jgi:hypothetical protein
MNVIPKEGDICKYLPTSTVGKVTEVRERDGRVWARLDQTDLFYDAGRLEPADPGEYKEVSFKERERSLRSGLDAVKAHKAEAEEVDISEFTPSGGG